jgi:hypothetical protein
MDREISEMKRLLSDKTDRQMMARGMSFTYRISIALIMDTSTTNPLVWLITSFLGVAYPFIPWCGIPESAIPCSKHPNLLLAEDLHFNNRGRCISFAELELQHLPCSITPSPPRSSWTWFQSDFTRTPNLM